MNIEERLTRIEAHLFGEDGKAKPQEKLRDFVVPLAHATLTREEVAARCIAAAQKKGCKPICYNELATLEGHVNKFGEGDARFFVCEKDGVYMFVHDHDGVSIATTLESFEEYCGVGFGSKAFFDRYAAAQPQQYVGLADETAEPQVHGIVNTLDAPPKAKTRLEWLNELPDGYRERAVANCTEWGGNSPQDVCDSMEGAIIGMCQWADTPEDWYFWDAVYLHYAHDQPLPPLPSGNSEKPNDHEPTDGLEMTDMRKLKFPNKFGTLDRFTYTDGTPYVDRELAVGEVIHVIDHFTGLLQELSAVDEDDVEERADEATEQPVYEAGFWFGGERHFLKLPDGTELYFGTKGCWKKDGSSGETQPHTLTPVSRHTVGKFYALAGIDGAHLSDWRSYALCVKNEDVPYFVRPTSEYGIVSVDRIRPSHVSLNEVTPV